MIPSKPAKRPKLVWIVLFLLTLLVPTLTLLSGHPPAGSVSMEKEIDALISKMTLEEKIDMLGGHKGFYLNLPKRLGLPEIRMADGPMGLRTKDGGTTAFPASIAMTATWNRDLLYKVGAAIGQECKAHGVGILLAPGVNMYRVPQNGRNFEYMGEDPFLASQGVTAYIKGVQDQGVMATVKHFVCNNQDYDRHRTSSDVDERTLREIYFPPFKAAVQEGGALAVMTAYNLVNGVHCSESDFLLNQVLKGDWGFKGMVMSDWISVYSLKPMTAGLDLEMPSPHFLNKKNLLPLIKKGEIKESLIDQKVRRILRSCKMMGLLDKNKAKNPPPPADLAAHDRLALNVAREGTVLLKNRKELLPLNPKKLTSIAVVGPRAHPTPASGDGAAMVKIFAYESIFQGIVQYLRKNTRILYYPFKKKTSNPDPFQGIEDCEAVVVCVGFNKIIEGEGHDRPFALPEEQRILLKEITQRNPNTVVVLTAGGGVKMTPWLDRAAAVLHGWYGGQQAGRAIADILFGTINPSGKLPISIEKEWKDSPAFNNYDVAQSESGRPPLYTINGKPHKTEHIAYKEGLYTGYRHFDKKGIEPLFPFGFGLSYTKFSFSNGKINKKVIKKGDTLVFSIDVTNTGKHAGAETVQVYVRDLESSVDRPVKELKGFEKVFLKPGETQTVKISLPPSAFAYYDIKKKDWHVEQGEFNILAGTSAADIHTQLSVEYR